MVTKIFIVRHTTRQDTVQSNWAETADYGYNPPLAELGHAQACETGRYIRSMLTTGPADSTFNPASRVMIHTSPFLRCVQTAAHIAEELIGCSPKIRMDAALGEWITPDYFPVSGPPPDDNHMTLANQAVNALQRQNKLRLVENGWNISCLGDAGSMREFWSEMHLRFEHYLKRLVGFYPKHNRKIDTLIIVTHGAGVSSLLTHLCGEPVLSEIRLGSVSLVSRDEDTDDLTQDTISTKTDGHSRSRASSITNWAWLGPEQVEEQFSIGSWHLDLLNVVGGTANAPNVDSLASAAGSGAASSSALSKQRTSSPAMFMLNTTFLGSAPPSTRTSRASSVLLRPSGPPPIPHVPEESALDEKSKNNSEPTSQLTPSSSVPTMRLVEPTLVTKAPATPPPPALESPETSPTTSPQFSSGSWLLGSNRW